MSTRFAVLAHDDPEMLRLLAVRLYPHGVWVHLDKSVNLKEYRAGAKQSFPPNVEFISERWDVKWGGYSVVEAMRACGSSAAVGSSPEDHIVFLSGRCYPIRPVDELVSHLSSSPRRQFARAYRLQGKSKWHTDRFELRHFFDLRVPDLIGNAGHRLLRNGAKQISRTCPRKRTSLDVVAGSQWMALTAGCLGEAINALESSEFTLFKNSFAPDEMAIQTFIHNSPWSRDTQAGGTEDLLGEDISSLPNLHFLLPRMSGLVSISDIQAAWSAGAFFVRKLDSVISADVIKFVEEISVRD